ncbi:group III truncated hemoglobin [Enterovirga sp.]|uniref:group III truncated hemoglobin n=1 Tax=Enterovirga sp. TaxID=2026350 RepID=UPI0026128D9B|nr:group III truncated hemoglobin [Enterovirga sp.]MDB5592487.1 hypothetical protein [Enterovirga sp.]
MQTELSEAAIAALLERFYGEVRRDPELGPVFGRAISDADWPGHMARIADFWSSVLLKTGRYQGNPFAVHTRVEGISPALFGRWLQLFDESCRAIFVPPLAEAVHARAVLIGDSLQAGLFFRPPLAAAKRTEPGSPSDP